MSIAKKAHRQTLIKRFTAMLSARLDMDSVNVTFSCRARPFFPLDLSIELSIEAHLYISAFFLGVHLEHLSELKVEHLSYDIAREYLTFVIVQLDHRIVVFPRVCNVFFYALKLILQVQKVGVRFQIGISFGNGEQRFQRTSKSILSRDLVLYCREIGRASCRERV